MGAAASMLEIDRNPELTQKLKEEYDRLSAEGYIDSQIEVQLRETYQDQVNEHIKKMKKVDLFARIAAANPTLKGVDISTSDVEMPKLEKKQDPSKQENGPGITSSKDRRNSRVNRRSFDNVDLGSRRNSNANSGGGSIKNRGGARAVASSKALQNANMNRRGTRKSFTGENNPLKRDQKDKTKETEQKLDHNASTPTIGENVEENFAKPPTPKQIEGKNFILLHEGPKLFWRQHITLYIHIYLHVDSDCVEVIGFNSEKFKEMNRSYLSYSMLKTITESAAVKRLEALLLEREEYGYRGPTLSEDELLAQEKEKAIVGHILNQMHLIEAQIEDFRYIPAKGTIETEGPELTVVPEEVSPVIITRRRHTNMDDVNKVLHSSYYVV